MNVNSAANPLPNVNLASAAPKPTQQTAAPPPSAKEAASPASSQEEIAIAAASRMADEKKAGNDKPVNGTALQRRVDQVQKINELLNSMNAEAQEKEISAKLRDAAKQSEERLSDTINDMLKDKSSDPAIVFLAIQKLSKDPTVAGATRDVMSSLGAEMSTDSRLNTAITASMNVADVANQYFDDPNMAAKFRAVYGAGNAETLSSNNILQRLFDVDNGENYDKLLFAYVDSLAVEHELATKMEQAIKQNPDQEFTGIVPSTMLGDITQRFSQMNEAASAMSIKTQVEKFQQTVNDKFEMHVQDTATLAKLALTFIDEPDQQAMEDIASTFMGFGNRKKAFFSSKLHDMTKELPMPAFNSDLDKRDAALSEIVKFTSRMSDVMPMGQGPLRLNKAFANM